MGMQGDGSMAENKGRTWKEVQEGLFPRNQRGEVREDLPPLKLTSEDRERLAEGHAAWERINLDFAWDHRFEMDDFDPTVTRIEFAVYFGKWLERYERFTEEERKTRGFDTSVQTWLRAEGLVMT